MEQNRDVDKRVIKEKGAAGCVLNIKCIISLLLIYLWLVRGKK